MKYLLALVLVCVSLVAVREEEPTPAWSSGRTAADWISTGLVGANLVADTIHSWHQPDRKQALMRESLRIGGTIALAEVVKRVVQRDRPDHSDHFSFFSEHTALAFAADGWNVNIAIPIALGAGYGRMAADKHHPSDVFVGALVGILASRLR